MGTDVLLATICRILCAGADDKRSGPCDCRGSAMDRPGETDDLDTATNGPISAFGEAQPPTEAERYRWIRANRNDAALHEALRSAHFDADFDDQIDAAMRAQREGRGSTTLPRAAKAFGRRRSDFD
jgi:hypothetical protein